MQAKVPAKSAPKLVSKAPKSTAKPKLSAKPKAATKKKVLADVDENADENVGKSSDQEISDHSRPELSAKAVGKKKTASETYTKVIVCFVYFRILIY